MSWFGVNKNTEDTDSIKVDILKNKINNNDSTIIRRDLTEKDIKKYSKVEGKYKQSLMLEVPIDRQYDNTNYKIFWCKYDEEDNKTCKLIEGKDYQYTQTSSLIINKYEKGDGGIYVMKVYDNSNKEIGNFSVLVEEK